MTRQFCLKSYVRHTLKILLIFFKYKLGTMMYLYPRDQGAFRCLLTMWCRFVTVHWHMSLLNVPSNSAVSLYSHPRRPLWRPPNYLLHHISYTSMSQTAAVSIFQPKESVPLKYPPQPYSTPPTTDS